MYCNALATSVVCYPQEILFKQKVLALIPLTTCLIWACCTAVRIVMVLLDSSNSSTAYAWSTQIFPVCQKLTFVLSFLLRRPWANVLSFCSFSGHLVCTLLWCGAHGSVCFGAWELPFYSRLRAGVTARIPFTTTVEWPELPRTLQVLNGSC